MLSEGNDDTETEVAAACNSGVFVRDPGVGAAIRSVVAGCKSGVAARESGVVAAREFGVVAAREFGVVAAREFGGVAAREFGVVATREIGVVTAREIGVVTAREFGVVIGFGGREGATRVVCSGSTREDDDVDAASSECDVETKELTPVCSRFGVNDDASPLSFLLLLLLLFSICSFRAQKELS